MSHGVKPGDERRSGGGEKRRGVEVPAEGRKKEIVDSHSAINSAAFIAADRDGSIKELTQLIARNNRAVIAVPFCQPLP